MNAIATALIAAQVGCGVILCVRLWRGLYRPPRLGPVTGELPVTPTTIVVATLNEAHRIAPLLAGVVAQGPPVIEVLVVDSHSTDGTRELVDAAARTDPRLHLLTDEPLPNGWIGKAWALEHARERAQGSWILGLDADTLPRPGLAAAIVSAAERNGYDVVSLAPRFTGQSALERWLQPALLTTLLYRFGAGVAGGPRNRVLANGQCFLVKRDMLAMFGGYEPVHASFAEDVSLARHLALHGASVAFLDGSLLLDVRSYDSACEMWREWGRSIDLKDSATPLRQAVDVAFLLMVQGLPVPVLLLGAVFAIPPILVVVNLALVVTRALLGVAIRRSYAARGFSYWFSPLADPLAFVRVLVSSLRRPKVWRGRNY